MRVIKLSKRTGAIVSSCMLAACGYNVNLEAAVDSKYLSLEFGDQPDAVETVQIKGQSYDFRVWIGKKHTERITVQATPAAVAATTSSVDKLTLGVVNRALNQAPYREAAEKHLAKIGASDCTLSVGQQTGLDRFSWNYQCASTAPARSKAKAGR